MVCIIDNFRRLKCVGSSRTQWLRRLNVDRGHSAELAYFFRAAANGTSLKPDTMVSLGVTLAAIRAREALSADRWLSVEIPGAWRY